MGGVNKKILDLVEDVPAGGRWAVVTVEFIKIGICDQIKDTRG